MAAEISRNHLWHGFENAPGETRWLTAGPVAAALEDGQLRGLWISGKLIVQRIYGAVRDRYWNTVPGVFSDWAISEEGGGFRVSFRSEHVSSEVDFVWDAVITGAADGTIRYEFTGTARREMAKNRIGLCVLLPLSVAGSAARVDYVSGDAADVGFPVLTDPMQPVRGLHDFRAITLPDNGSGAAMAVSFEGDVFEIEDQRNWTDASFKIYSTPQRIPMPALLRAGHEVRQSITLRLIPGATALAAPVVPPDCREVAVTVGEECAVLPEIGVGMAFHGAALTAPELVRLKSLHLAHYRIELDPADASRMDEFRVRLAEALAMETRAEVAVLFSSAAADEAARVAAVAAEFPGVVCRWIVLTKGAPASRAETLAAVAAVLGRDGAAVGGGTDADFFQLNNNRLTGASPAFVSVPLRPCAHQFDLATMIENLDGQRAVLAAMRAIWPALPLVVSPVSIRTRAQKGPAAGAGELPAQADPRQMSLFGAGWTIGSLRAIAEAGVASVTFFQTTGLRGIMERAGGSDAPRDFHSIPGGVFPVFLVLAALAEWSGAAVCSVRFDQSGTMEALALSKNGRTRLLLANLTAKPRTAILHGVPQSGQVVILDATNALAAMQDPEGWLANPPSMPLSDQAVVLPEFGFARVDFS